MVPPSDAQQPLQHWAAQQQHQSVPPMPNIVQQPSPQQQQQQQQAPVPNMSGQVPAHLGMVSPMGSATPTFTNPNSPWFSPQHPYQQIGQRRNDPMDFRYGQQAPQAPQQGTPQQHHPGQPQQPMSVPQHPQHQQQPHQQHPQHPHQAQQPAPQAAHQQQQQQQPSPHVATPQSSSAVIASPVTATAPTPRQRKRPNPATAQPSNAPSPIVPPMAAATPSSAASASVPPQSTAAPPSAGTAISSVETPIATHNNASVEDGGLAAIPPPAKKTRTNTPWTPAEEHRLKQMRDAGHSWAEIAKTFPTRTEGSVKKHWYKDMHYAEFAEDESTALLNAIKEYENQKWKVIGQKVGKPAKACEQYAKEHFADHLNGKR